MEIEFTEFPPSQPLSLFVQSYWTGTFNKLTRPDFAQSVVPNGYIELIIHLTDDHCALSKDAADWDASPDYTLIGLYTKPYEVRFSSLVRVFGIRFYPEGIMNVFGVPPALFLSTFEDGADVFGRKFKDYCTQLREKLTHPDRIALTENFLLKFVEQNSKNYDYARLAARLIRQRQGMMNQAELQSEIPISDRQLQREFKKQYGITAKAYMRLMRLNAIQKYMQSNSDVKLTEVAYEHGFSDQSHFIKEFKDLIGNNPRAFAKERDRFIVNP